MTTPITGEFELRNVSYVEESEFDTTPGSPTMLELWQNTFRVQPTRDKKESRRRLGDGQQMVGRLTRYNNTAQLEVELVVGNHDFCIEALLGQKFPSSLFTQVAASTIAVTDTETITDSGSGFGSIAAGDWIIVAGFTTSANNGVKLVKTAAAGALVVANLDGTDLVPEIAGDSVTIDQLYMISNDRNVYSYTFEDRQPDVAVPYYHRLRGSTFDNGAFRFDNEIAMATFGLVCGTFERATSSLGTPTAGLNREPCDSLNGSFLIGTTAARLSSASFNLNRNIRLSKPLGTSVGDEPFLNQTIGDGQFSQYAEDDQTMVDWAAETKKQLTFTISWGSYKYEFNLLYCLLTQVQKEEGEEGATMWNTSFDIRRHPKLLKTIAVRRYTA